MKSSKDQLKNFLCILMCALFFDFLIVPFLPSCFYDGKRTMLEC